VSEIHIIWEGLPWFILVLIRVGAVFFSMPILGSRSIPLPARVGLALALSWALFPLVRPDDALHGSPPVGQSWGLAAVRELLVGLTLGWTVNFLLAAVPLAGQLLGFQMGLGLANIMDPLGQQQLSVPAQFLNLLALWLFLSLNGHYLVISALVESFQWWPLAGGGSVGRGGWGALALGAGRHIFTSALIVAAPVTLVLLTLQVALGIVARTVPQMNVFFVAIPLQIGLGLAAIGAFLRFFAPWMARELSWLKGILSALAGAG